MNKTVYEPDPTPLCPHCRSINVQAINQSAASESDSNNEPDRYHCNACGEHFFTELPSADTSPYSGLSPYGNRFNVVTLLKYSLIVILVLFALISFFSYFSNIDKQRKPGSPSTSGQGSSQGIAAPP